MLLSNRAYKYRTALTVCFYAGIILFISASAGIAQDAPGSATSILENAIEVSKSSEEGLNELWKITFTGTYSPGYLAVMDFARKVHGHSILLDDHSDHACLYVQSLRGDIQTCRLASADLYTHRQ